MHLQFNDIIEVFENTNYKCNFCENIYSGTESESSEKLIKHVNEIHKDVDVHICQMCFKSFSQLNGVTGLHWHIENAHMVSIGGQKSQSNGNVSHDIFEENNIKHLEEKILELNKENDKLIKQNENLVENS